MHMVGAVQYREHWDSGIGRMGYEEHGTVMGWANLKDSVTSLAHIKAH